MLHDDDCDVKNVEDDNDIIFYIQSLTFLWTLKVMPIKLKVLTEF